MAPRIPFSSSIWTSFAPSQKALSESVIFIPSSSSHPPPSQPYVYFCGARNSQARVPVPDLLLAYVFYMVLLDI